MIYLGEQKRAREKFYAQVHCWVNKKLRGTHSCENPSGYKCEVRNCEVCTTGFQKLKVHPFHEFILLNLERIILCKPSNFKDLESEIYAEWEERYPNGKDDIEELCEQFFVQHGYKQWFNQYSINYKLAEWLDIHTCVYCNRQYIFVARRKDGEKGINCQFDHWYDKGKHPLFGLSFYNLIPCCSLCNGSMKKSKSFHTLEHAHPYVDSDITERFRFTYKLTSITERKIEINFDPADTKMRKTLEDLGTRVVYEKHSDKELQDLLDLRYKYSENYLRILTDDTFKNFDISKDEMYRLIFGIELDKEDYHKRPLSKFKADIIVELLNRYNKTENILWRQWGVME